MFFCLQITRDVHECPVWGHGSSIHPLLILGRAYSWKWVRDSKSSIPEPKSSIPNYILGRYNAVVNTFKQEASGSWRFFFSVSATQNLCKLSTGDQTTPGWFLLGICPKQSQTVILWLLKQQSPLMISPFRWHLAASVGEARRFAGFERVNADSPKFAIYWGLGLR